MQGFFAQTQAHDIVKATPEEQAEWKAKVDADRAGDAPAALSDARAKDEEKGKLEAQLEALDEKMPLPLTSLYAVADVPKEVTPIHILARGDYRNKGAKVGMRPLGVLLADDAPERPVDAEKPRTALAEWITDPANPLTARVMVNRIWLYHFGRGIVSTPNDFGRMGDAALASGAARLAGQPIRGGRVEDETDSPG